MNNHTNKLDTTSLSKIVAHLVYESFNLYLAQHSLFYLMYDI